MASMLKFISVLLVTVASPALCQSTVSVPREPVGTAPPLPPGTPQPPPAYMKDNINNFFGTAPDHGSLNGPVLGPLDGSILTSINSGLHSLLNKSDLHSVSSRLSERQSNADNYWLSSYGPDGQMPLAPSGYQFFRNVKDFGAVGDGVTDDTAAINRAAATYGLNDLNDLRCGESCGSTTVLGAVVYFPPGTYLISTPIIQYYYTQFVGNPNEKPTIKGTFNFTGIALIDSDVYIPGGNSAEWYINQSNFYRQIRNFNFDMTGMNWTNTDNDQTYVPSGVHWQVGQATSITYCNFNMAVSQGSQSATAIGIYMENGSGGFVSDLTFFGGNIGFYAGSQQFTVNNLQFTSCLTAIKHVFNWGFNWHNIYVLSCYIALDCTAYSGVENQGTGSITVLDSHFNGVPYAITIAESNGEQPNIVLDNLLVENSQSVVLISGGATILEGSSGPLYFNSWANGYQYLPDGSGGKATGFISPTPDKPSSLLNNGAYFTQSKPQYFGSTPVVATSHGVSNDGTGDQTAAINSLLSGNVGSVIFFPGGIYTVQDTVKIPVDSIIIGSGWSQIMGTGSYFANQSDPQVMVQVGNVGDSGTIEISDMLFTVKGATAGAILMQWNVQESSQGSAAMWDSHFRVGGAQGTDLQLANCPTGGSSVQTSCMAASMLLHLTSESSGYFENVWAWVADHDLDNDLNAQASESNEGIPLNVKTDISVYSGRGILIESQGPTWFWGTASEHSQLYQYQLSNASEIYMGVMQTETPYYQPNPNALSPYTPGQFTQDPTFDDCSDDLCTGAWALRVLNSSSVFIYSAGFYSFFQNNQLGCAPKENCQLALIETDFSGDLWIYNIFTKGNVEIVTPRGDIPVLLFNSTTTDGYTSEIAAWLALAEASGEEIGQSGNSSGYVTIDPDLWSEPAASRTVQCIPPCTYVLPPLTLTTDTTFSFPPLTTEITVGYNSTTSFTQSGITSSVTLYAVSVETTTITIPAVTTSILSWFDVTVTGNSTIIYPFPSITQTYFNITPITVISSITVSPSPRTFYPPPWPGSTVPPDLTMPPSSTSATSSQQTSTTAVAGVSVHHTRGPPSPTCTHVLGCWHSCGDSFFDICSPCWLFCGGPPSLDGPDPNQPGGDSPPGGDPDEQSTSSECETSTYSACSTICTQAQSSCRTSCQETVGCSSTSDTFTCQLQTITNIWTSTASDEALPSLGGGGIFGFTYLPAATTVTIPSSTSSSTPVTTVIVTKTITPTVVPSTVTITTTTTVRPTTTTQTVVVSPTLEANCDFWDEGWGWTFEVYNIEGWANDHGEGLHHQETGCGALTGWKWTDGTSTEGAKAYFNLPFFIKDGCVERAIVSAGGPKISCKGHGLSLKRRLALSGEEPFDEEEMSEMLLQQEEEKARAEERAVAAEALRVRAAEFEIRKRSITSDSASQPSISSTPSYSYGSMTTSTASYIPQNWTGTNNTLIFTWTFISETLTDMYASTYNVTETMTTYTTVEPVTSTPSTSSQSSTSSHSTSSTGSTILHSSSSSNSKLTVTPTTSKSTHSTSTTTHSTSKSTSTTKS